MATFPNSDERRRIESLESRMLGSENFTINSIAVLDDKMLSVEFRATTLEGRASDLEAKVAANQADSTATELAGLVTDFNTLLAALKAAGLMEPDADPEP